MAAHEMIKPKNDLRQKKYKKIQPTQLYWKKKKKYCEIS